MAIVQNLTSVHINFSTGDGLKEVVRARFKEKWGVPQRAGSIDGSNVPVIPPVMNHIDYYIYWYSMLAQATRWRRLLNQIEMDL